jgi:hypothetical protein
VIYAQLPEVIQSAIMLLTNNQAIYFDKGEIIMNEKLVDETDFDFEGSSN